LSKLIATGVCDITSASVFTKEMMDDYIKCYFSAPKGHVQKQETPMSKIPPSEWPIYNSTSECSACGSDETEDQYGVRGSCVDNLRSVPDNDAPYIARRCKICSFTRYERPLDFDFDAWRAVWAAEKALDDARKALEE